MGGSRRGRQGLGHRGPLEGSTVWVLVQVQQEAAEGCFLFCFSFCGVWGLFFRSHLEECGILFPQTRMKSTHAALAE